MKKTIISIAICASSIFANAQSSNYKLIEWEIFGMGVSVPFLPRANEFKTIVLNY